MSENYYDRRLREKAETAAVEKRKQERAAHYKAQQLPEIWKRQAASSAAQAANSQAWCEYVDRRIDQRISEWWSVDRQGNTPLVPLLKELGEVFAEEHRERRKEINTAVEEVKRGFKTALEALELRLLAHVDRRISEHIGQTADRAIRQWDAIAKERQDWRGEIKSVIDAAQSNFRGEVDTRFAALEQRVMLRMRADRPIVAHDGKDADPETVARIVGEQIEAPLNGFIREQIDAKFAALEQRLKAVLQAEQQANNQRWAAIDQRIEHLEREMDGRLGPSALQETQCAVESKLESKLQTLEQRLKSVPGKLPVAKTWHPESVTYQSEFVSHDGALWQARKDTAQPPGGSDWVCVAAAGRDAITPTVKGTYDAREHYKALDIVAMDGASFIAKQDNPGAPGGDGWQMIARQGNPGRQGAAGPRGARGEKGERGEDGATTVSWQVDRVNYRVSPLMSNGKVGPMLLLRGLYEQFIIDRGE